MKLRVGGDAILRDLFIPHIESAGEPQKWHPFLSFSKKIKSQ